MYKILVGALKYRFRAYCANAGNHDSGTVSNKSGGAGERGSGGDRSLRQLIHYF